MHTMYIYVHARLYKMMNLMYQIFLGQQQPCKKIENQNIINTQAVDT